MNGPEHYRMAERILARADKAIGLGAPAEAISLLMAGAQVHATLATAAATALAAMTGPAFYPQPVTQFGDDTHTVDALNDWHAEITIAVPAAPVGPGAANTPSATPDAREANQ